ncbi:replication initiation factor domain-containing protein [Enterococcus faecalis]|uniref:XRE family transcriptional regulator n=1 Tax=Enterococcus faecalis TaxID=1351 RepID=UPI0012E1453C|nr:XRE family transcriptional regulator [Enterococcus faecalis]EGO5016452.1 XRE family transcriptional regulator [Enterococcus faecalis]EGO6562252.1 XRE family transcriptional regulator [Enterococcus faecalis]EGO7560209.1 XRE family transcriptional regulator [Enterococcus faecalis]EGO7742207.1 XRE family transcriptional regulator [Enterococcus faecalis]EGO8387381.1 XRE family transcriptional regulator [Enterococcus faecalis]
MNQKNPLKTGIQIKNSRLVAGITQQELATQTGISRSSLSKIERSTQQPNPLTLEKINQVLEQLNPEQPLYCIFDYVRIRVETHDSNFVIEQLLGLKKEFMLYEDRGFYGYVATYSFDAIKVMLSPDNDNKGTLIELSGRGCRSFESFLTAQARTWFDFFRTCKKASGHFTRLDVAINDRKGLLSIEGLLEKVMQGECVTRFKTCDFNGSRRFLTGESQGTTLYFGSKKGEVYFCFYQKNYEELRKKGIPLEESPIINRYELRFKNKRAEAIISDLLSRNDINLTVFETINHYLRFVDLEGKRRRTTVAITKEWQTFIGDYQGQLRLVTEPNELFYEKSVEWWRKSIAPTTKMLVTVDRIRKTQVVKDMIKEATLSEKQKHIIKAATTPIEDILVVTKDG